MDRRALIRSGALASIAAATGLSAGASPRQGGTVRIAAPGPGRAPWTTSDGVGRLLLSGAVFEPLFSLGAGGELRPGLADAWHSSVSGDEWSIRLRKDARFHDGTPLRPEDVVTSFAEALVPGHAQIEASGSDVIRIRLDAPDPGFPLTLADPRFAIRSADDAGMSLGTGPFRIAAAEDGQRTVLQRVARTGWFDAIEILRVSDPTERAAALLSGRVDLADDLPDHAAGELRRGRHVITERLAGASKLWMRAGSAAAADMLSEFGQGAPYNGPIRTIQVSVAPGASERTGTDDVLRALLRWLRQNEIHATADTAPDGLTVGASPADAVPDGATIVAHRDAVLGMSTRLGHQRPPDLTRIAENWFFT